jgi:hypothetical protein
MYRLRLSRNAYVKVCKLKMKIGIFLWHVSTLQMNKREKVSDMARTAAFTVDVVEKSQAIPTSVEKSQAIPTSVEKSQAIPTYVEKSQAIPTSVEKSQAIPTSVEKSQAIPTSPVVSLEAWSRGVNMCHTWTVTGQRNELREQINVTNR